MIVAGAVAACVLGAGLGFWARPTVAAGPRPGAAPAAPATPQPQLQIVVDDAPAPVGRPLEVLPETAAPNPIPIAPPIRRHIASGLLKVDAPIAAEAVTAPKVIPAVRRVAKAPDRPKPKAATPPRPKAAPKPVLAKPAVKRKADVARVEKTKTGKARSVNLAKADPPRKATRPAETRARPAAASPKVAKAAAKPVKTERRTRSTQVADARPLKPKTQKPLRKAPRLEKASTPPARPKAVRPQPRGEGPLRVARANPCASADPGEAVVCADRRLGARDRQLQQAYRTAEAAGVPASALRRQQSRWLQARAAAAREAPWAVEDVYVARISELNDQIRDAREN